MADNVVVTGSRVERPALAAPSPFEPMTAASSYSSFLARLQSAVRSGDRHALIGLIAFPLRVNAAGGARTYRDPAAVGRDFDLIFTPRVRRAILAQRAEKLFVRDQGAMVGDGQLWFRETCTNPACSPPGPVRIVAVNP